MTTQAHPSETPPPVQHERANEYDIFISYSSKDSEIAQLVLLALEANHFRCFIAPRDIPSGANYAKTIVQAIKQSEIVLLIFSSACNASPHIASELENSMNNKIPRLVLRIEHAIPSEEMQYLTSQSQWIDASSGPIQRHLVTLIYETKRFVKNRKVIRRQERKKKVVRQFVAAACVCIMILLCWKAYEWLQAGPSILPNSLTILPIEAPGVDGKPNPSYSTIPHDLSEAFATQHAVTIQPFSRDITDSDARSDLGVSAKKSHARFLLNNSIVDANSKEPRFSVQLIDTKRGQEEGILWAATYPIGAGRTPQSIAQIVRHVNLSIRLELSPARSALPDDVFRSYRTGRMKLMEGTLASLSEAVTIFHTVAEKAPGFADGVASLADAELANYEEDANPKSEWMDSAYIHANRAIALDHKNSEAVGTLGRYFLWKGMIDTSISLLEYSLSVGPDNLSSNGALGAIYTQIRSHPTKAIRFFEKAVELDPVSSVNHNNLGVINFKLGRLMDSYRELRTAIQLSPENNDAWRNLGLYYQRTRNIDSAQLCYDRARTINPADVSAYENQASYLFSLGKIKQADSIITIGLSLQPQQYELLYFHGLFLDQSQHSQSAAKAWELAKAYASSHYNQDSLSSALIIVALAKARLRLVDDALRDVSELEHTFATVDVGVEGLVRAFAVLGNKEKMLEWFSTAHKMSISYDEDYIATMPDLHDFRNDPDLLAKARQ